MQHIYRRHLVWSRHTREKKASPQVSFGSNEDACVIWMPCGMAILGLYAMVASHLLPGRSTRSTGHSRNATGSAPFALRYLPTTARATTTFSSSSCSAGAAAGSRSGYAGARIVKFGRGGGGKFGLLDGGSQRAKCRHIVSSDAEVEEGYLLYQFF